MRILIAELSCSISVVPLFPGLRRFPQGRGFKQWTGNDSKALMKVFLPAIVGHVPPQMVRAIATFIEFCYIVRRSVITTEDLVKLEELLTKFHEEREIFRTEGVRPDGFNLPRQHALNHYRISIRKFGAPNGLCSSITESRHITAIRKPWRRSNRFKALGQMLLTNQRLDKLHACGVDFQARGMLDGSVWGLPAVAEPNNQRRRKDDDEDDDGGAVDDKDVIGEVKLAQKPSKCMFSPEFRLINFTQVRGISHKLLPLAAHLNIPSLPEMISEFLYEQENQDQDAPAFTNLPPNQRPQCQGKIIAYPSAVATFYAPSDISGINGMCRERIRSVDSWLNGPERRDCVFVEHTTDAPGFQGMFVAQVHAFLKVKYGGQKYPCAVVSWFSTVGNSPCPQTGMWMVERDLDANGRPEMSVIHLESILRSAHLIGIAGSEMIPPELSYHDSLRVFKSFYVNKFIDYQAHEIIF